MILRSVTHYVHVVRATSRLNFASALFGLETLLYLLLLVYDLISHKSRNHYLLSRFRPAAVWELDLFWVFLLQLKHILILCLQVFLNYGVLVTDTKRSPIILCTHVYLITDQEESLNYISLCTKSLCVVLFLLCDFSHGTCLYPTTDFIA